MLRDWNNREMMINSDNELLDQTRLPMLGNAHLWFEIDSKPNITRHICFDDLRDKRKNKSDLCIEFVDEINGIVERKYIGRTKMVAIQNIRLRITKKE